MGLSAGTNLGPYEVLEPIGSGGMGEVFRARDTKLNRDVALKVLPDAVAEDRGRLARFQREAEVLASLNHPNIAQIHGLEDSGDTRALVLELVEGPTLADRIAQGAIAIDEAVAIARQIANALEAAHEAGVIHRDLKPANVKVKEDGSVKVLDFGLAKALGVDDREGDPSESPTLTTAATRAGVIMGTAAYMSPEQAKGKAVDKRADIWGFGAVLYEMLTGKRPFAGDDVSETLAFVLTKEPNWSVLPRNLSPSLQTYLKRCLEKDPKQRVRDVGDVRLALDGAFDTVVETSTPGGASRLPWVAALVVSVLTGLVVWGLMRSPPPEVTRFAYELPAGQQFRYRGRPVLAVSPDGRRLAYNTTAGVYVRSMDQLDAQLLPGTEVNLRNVFFSPDGQSVGYQFGGLIQRLAVSGGAPVVICELEALLSAHWARDDTIFLGTRGGVMRVPANGGTPELVIPAEDGELLDVHQLLPDNDTLLVSANASGLTVASAWDSGRIVAASLSSGERTVLVEGGTDARYVPSGHLVYAFEDGLFAVPFDATSLRVTGGPVSLIQGVDRAGVAASANYGISDDGTLVFVAGGLATSVPLTWVDRSGRASRIETIPSNEYGTPRLSPDGERVLVVADGDVRVYDLASGRESRLTTHGGAGDYADWTPAGDEVAYTSSHGGGMQEVWIQHADGSGPARELTALDGRVHFDDWAPDGRTFSAHQHGVGVPSIQLMVTYDGESAEPETWLQNDYSNTNAVFSPDGRYVALASDQTGQNEIYIQPYPGPGGRVPVSVGGGIEPAWAANGELFYRRPVDYTMMAVEVSTEPVLEVGPPTELFPGGRHSGGSPRARYAVTADGQQFLMSAASLPLEDGSAVGQRPKIVVVQNWVEELKARVPN